MQLRYQYRLDPAPRHAAALARAFGCARVVFNDALRARQQAHVAGLPYPTDVELSRRLTLSKRTPERAWLTEVSSVVLQQALGDLNKAYRNFFSSLSGKRGGDREYGRPAFVRARTTGRRYGSPVTPVSRCCRAANCGYPRSEMYRSAGLGRCHPTHLA